MHFFLFVIFVVLKVNIKNRNQPSEHFTQKIFRLERFTSRSTKVEMFPLIGKVPRDFAPYLWLFLKAALHAILDKPYFFFYKQIPKSSFRFLCHYLTTLKK